MLLIICGLVEIPLLLLKFRAIEYALAGFTPFITILGGYTGTKLKIESYCSAPEQQSNKGFSL